MKRWLDSPAFLLLGTGLFLGLYFPLGKQAGAAGVNPIAWSLAISFIPGLALLIASLATDKSSWRSDLIPFGLIAGVTAYVVPNSLTFASIQHVGSGYVALMFALSPVFTAFLSMIVRVRPPDRKLLIGVGFGLLGALLVVFSRTQLSTAGDFWLVAAALIPISLACGNVYRTARWPQGTTALRAGAVANLGSVPLYLVVLSVTHGFQSIATLVSVPWLTLTQLVVSSLMFLLFFRLQLVGGPTYLSQIGYVAAAVGLFFGSFILGESYPMLVWIGAASIGAGFVISNWRPLSRRG